MCNGHECKQDPDYSCSDTQTCCLLPAGEGVGCCPYQDATCCKDRTHCCPHGMTCDIQAGRCVGSFYQLLMSKVIAPKTVAQKSKTIESNLIPKLRNFPSTSSLFTKYNEKKLCPDKDFSCDETQTCCELLDGGYGCCPLGPDAICCEDREHCCPHGTVCDIAGGACTPKLE